MDWAVIISVTMKKRERFCRFYEIGFSKIEYCQQLEIQ